MTAYRYSNIKANKRKQSKHIEAKKLRKTHMHLFFSFNDSFNVFWDPLKGLDCQVDNHLF